MCWCEQISPLAHSSQATWQPFNLSHCIEMHNTHLLGRAGQLSQAYFTHSAPILTPRNLPPTVNKQWLPLRESRMSRHTRFNQPKNGNCRYKRYLSWYKCSWQVDTAIGPNPILYFYCVENVYILVICNAIREFVTETLIQIWWNAATQGLPRMRQAISVSCQVATLLFGWFQHRIHSMLPYTMCDLTVLLRNY